MERCREKRKTAYMDLTNAAAGVYELNLGGKGGRQRASPSH
jgi:hypothetical protein